MNKKLFKRIARTHIEELFRHAENIQKIDQGLANIAVKRILEISKHYKVRLTKEQKLRICKNCKSFITPGRNAEVILKDKVMIIKCLECGKEKRWPYGNNRKRSRSNNKKN